jgi:hypothetical protein
MKPIGWKKMYKEANSADKMPKKSVKTFKRGAKQVFKMKFIIGNITRGKPSPYDFED